ncbi:protoplasts-secreted [Mucor velutinosus]|uniref:Protoplasts-secreted n=1 Tax=Mucor velutinosus TaxID=708070 RepID=A0AAN7DJA2_9FUNG|nr:protoplasts-secreted [Mucor velutinosus]
MIEKGPIFVSGADGDKGYAIVKKLLDTPNLLRLDPQPVYAGVIDTESELSQEMGSLGANVLYLNVLENYDKAVDALKNAAKLILVIDPLNKRMAQDNLFRYGQLLIDAAKAADIQHIIFLTPFSKLDRLTPPSTAFTAEKQPPTTYRSQFMLVQTYLESVFNSNMTTILCYPGILHQHLLVFKHYIQQHNAFPLPYKCLESSVESSNLDDIARAAAYIAHSPTSRHGDKEYKLTGPQILTLKEVCSNVLHGLGCSIQVDTMDVYHLRDILVESMGAQNHADFLLEIWGLQKQQQLQGRRRFEITRDLEALTGQSGKTLLEYIRDDSVSSHFRSSQRIALS